ncbi:MAG TPA: hypothetical protein PKZ17_06140 [Thermodesulfovibrio thiophilus]|nr:hypothetical protein [Thermodesulfovibrio thiophilus]HQA04294.1 hypothetical protein [Thermodesulfovibrio thiophilus]
MFISIFVGFSIADFTAFGVISWNTALNTLSSGAFISSAIW